MSKTQTILTIILTLFSFIPLIHAEPAMQQVVTVENREVLLKTDGSWEYRSIDRFANTKDGTRIQLKDDGSWTAIGNTPLTSEQQVRTTELAMTLQKVVIETYRKKTQKNTSVKTQTVFYVQLNYSPQADKDVSINSSDITLIEVKDNNGNNYPVLSIEPESALLKPDTDTILVVRAKKSPSIWDNVKSMEIVFNSGILGLEAPVSLSQKTIDFDEANVESLE